MPEVKMPAIKVLAFDVFGTLVDWRTSIAREAAAVFARLGSVAASDMRGIKASGAIKASAPNGSV